ncbi:hypothetical protein EOD42_22635 [Rhodovarius crocodyli]|uniref:Uncharacterized protein n=1 Tax=Rhodovarius crocodyli TaxID=1979269 RepID=A0A437M1K1_9PROT|nr:hypothetical protein [Rhodovarius crocodyli]RVT91456.1 hypothetical protein EOD42_22635 [Rhodovarius crocodyli]
MLGLEFFQCERTRSRLSTAGCARLWLSVEKRPPQLGETRNACIGCPIGARHAGVDPEKAAVAARARELEPLCVRCTAGDRRLIRGLYCISCYNRQREVARGRDARGKVPGLAAALHPISIVISSTQPLHRRYGSVSSRVEAMLIAAKETAGAATVIGFHRLGPIPDDALPELGPGFAGASRRPRYRRQWRRAGFGNTVIPTFANALKGEQLAFF